MTDVFSKDVRSRIMAKIKGKNTTPELLMKPLMKVLGFTHQPKGVIGKPDFASKKLKVAIFIDGCFWHGCPKHYKTPKSNKEYWVEKITSNKNRDRKNQRALSKNGWKVIRIWEHAISKN